MAYVQTVQSTVTTQSYLRTPNAPDFSVATITSTGATFSWTAVPGATKYRVYVSTGVINPQTATTGIEVSQTSYVYTSGSPNTL